MDDIKFNISEHWLPVNEKRGTIDKDTLRIKVSGINFHTQQEASSWGIFPGYIKPDTNNSKRVRDAAFFLIIMLVTFAATLLKPQKYVSSRTIQKCVEHVSTST